jgi:hypothetical protein
VTLFLNVMNDGWSSFSFLHTHLFQENSFFPNCISFAHPAEMEVTEIILAIVLRLCQLSSHSHGFLSRI